MNKLATVCPLDNVRRCWRQLQFAGLAPQSTLCKATALRRSVCMHYRPCTSDNCCSVPEACCNVHCPESKPRGRHYAVQRMKPVQYITQ